MTPDLCHNAYLLLIVFQFLFAVFMEMGFDTWEAASKIDWQ